MRRNGSRATRVEQAKQVALLAAAFAGAAAVSLAVSRRGDDMAGLWLANALVFVMMARWREWRRQTSGSSLAACMLGFAAASLIVNLAAHSSAATAVLFAVANVLHVLLCLALGSAPARAVRSGPLELRSFALVLAMTAGVATAVTAFLFAVAASLLHGWELTRTTWVWMAANALGFSIVLPVGLTASREALARLRRPAPLLRLVGVAAGSAVWAAAMLSWSEFPVVLAMVPLLLAAPRLSIFELAVACAVTGAAMVATAYGGFVPGLDSGIAAFSKGFQLSVAVIVLMPFLGGLLLGELAQDRRRLSLGKQRFRRAMHDSPIGVAIIALDGRITEANPSLAHMLGYSRHELESMHFSEITHPDDRDSSEDTMCRVRAGELDSYRSEKRYLHKEGRAVWAQLSGSVIRDAETGEPLYLVSQIEDIDARKRAEQRNAELETRWNVALATAGQGVWDVDMRKGTAIYSGTWAEMLGFEPGELDGDPDRWLTMIHPEDAERVRQADRDHVEGRTPFFEAEFRMRRKDGGWIWVLDRGQIIERDETGGMLRAIGTLTDITARKEAEERVAISAAMLAEEKERLRVTLQSIGDAVICTDSAGRITFMNATAEKLTASAAATAIGKPFESVYLSVDEETGGRLHSLAAEGAASRQNSRAVLVRRDGSRCSIREVVSPILGPKGELYGHIVIFQDFTDARTLQRELAHAAAHDALTGLANRTSFSRRLGELIGDTQHAVHQFLFVDLDRFKAVNDTSGHVAGDALLRVVADAIRKQVRASDLVARLGGDEFALLLADCTTERAEQTARNIVSVVERLEFSWAGVTHSIGASVGLTTITASDSTVEEIITRADAACYAAKAEGRGRVAAAA